MFIIIGTNHKYSPIEIREKLAFSKKKREEALRVLIGYKAIRAGLILSTCNRIEIYADVSNIEEGIEILKHVIASDCEPNAKSGFTMSLFNYLYIYANRDAISHLFSVACGLDSQIIGEMQILEQVGFAWQEAKMVEATNNYIDFIFDKAIRIGLKVRRETGISSGNISVASVTLELMKTKFTDIREKRALIIGVGKISELVLQHLKEEGLNSVFIANKTFEKAKRLAGSINAEVVRFDQLREKLREADVVITATASPHLILKKEDILETMNYKLSTINHKLLIIDLAVPRDVAPEVKDIKEVELYDLDSLNFIIEKNLVQRKQEVPKVLRIIKQEVENLCLKEYSRSEPEPALLR